jgi:hypothetical protein
LPTCELARLFAQQSPNQHELSQPVKISKALHSDLPQRTGNPAQRSSAGYPLAARRIQPVAVRAAWNFVMHKPGSTFAVRKLLVRLHIQQAKTVV